MSSSGSRRPSPGPRMIDIHLVTAGWRERGMSHISFLNSYPAMTQVTSPRLLLTKASCVLILILKLEEAESQKYHQWSISPATIVIAAFPIALPSECKVLKGKNLIQVDWEMGTSAIQPLPQCLEQHRSGVNVWGKLRWKGSAAYKGQHVEEWNWQVEGGGGHLRK